MGKSEDVVMSMFPSGRFVVGWSVPDEAMHGFLQAVDEAAKAVGGVPIIEVDISDGGAVTESEARRESMDCGLIDQAEAIIREA